MGTPPPPLGLQVKRARERLRMTQAELGNAVGVTQKTIDNWEHDRSYPKSSIGALEEVLGVPLGEQPPEPAAARPADDLVRQQLIQLERMADELRAQLGDGDAPLRRLA